MKHLAEQTLYRVKENLYQLNLRQVTNIQNLQRIAEIEYQEN